MEDSRARHSSWMELYAAFYIEGEIYSAFRIYYLTELGFVENTYIIGKNETSEFRLRESKIFEIE